ncbi:hypothetical protein Trydic_g20767 [Trypoxylus dichotomus]
MEDQVTQTTNTTNTTNITDTTDLSRSKFFLADRSLDIRSAFPMEPETGVRILLTSVCIPDACAPSEMLESLFLNYLPLIQAVDSIAACETVNDRPEMTDADLAFIIFISIIAALVVICTAYDEIIRDKRKPPHPVYVSFSITRNFQKITKSSTGQDRISCLDGLRVFSILWVIMGHRYSILEILPFVNKDYAEIWQRKLYTQYIQGAPTAVDTFLFLTGLLMAMSFLKVYNKPKTKFNIIIYYIHRYLRLTPALAVVYFLHVSVFLHFGDGPLWKYVTERTRENCLNRWASFFFYYQNYLDYNNMCLLHTWYLSMDMQIFILSPLVLIPLTRRRKLMMRAGLPILILLSMACPFIITYYYETEILTEKYYDYYYYPTHTRLSPWLIGTFAGAILHVYKNAKLTIHPIINVFIWAVVVSGMVACILTGNHITYNYDRLSTSLYLSLYRPAWCCGLTWIVFACVKGRGGIFNYVLSADIFQILAKLTYAMYLVHITCLVRNVATTRYPAQFGDFEVLHLFLGDILMTIAVAFVWSLLFESPIVAVERFLLGGGARRKDKETPAPITQVGEANTTPTQEMKIEDSSVAPEPPLAGRHLEPQGFEEDGTSPVIFENGLIGRANNEDDTLPEVIVENNLTDRNFIEIYPVYDEIMEDNETLPDRNIENDILISNDDETEQKGNEEATADIGELEQENDKMAGMENESIQEGETENDKTLSSDVDEQSKHEEDHVNLEQLENEDDKVPDATFNASVENIDSKDDYATPNTVTDTPIENTVTDTPTENTVTEIDEAQNDLENKAEDLESLREDVKVDPNPVNSFEEIQDVNQEDRKEKDEIKDKPLY